MGCLYRLRASASYGTFTSALGSDANNNITVTRYNRLYGGVPFGAYYFAAPWLQVRVATAGIGYEYGKIRYNAGNEAITHSLALNLLQEATLSVHLVPQLMKSENCGRKGAMPCAQFEV